MVTSNPSTADDEMEQPVASSPASLTISNNTLHEKQSQDQTLQQDSQQDLPSETPMNPIVPLGVGEELDKVYLKEVLLRMWETKKTESLLLGIAGILRFDSSDTQRAKTALNRSSSMLSFSLPELTSVPSAGLVSNLVRFRVDVLLSINARA